MATYFYVAADDAGNIVTGITTNLAGSMAMMRNGYEKKASATKLVFARIFDSLHAALEYEKYFIGLSPRQRTRLIEAINPHWDDWSDDMFPAIAGMAYAEAVSDVLDRWLEDGDDDTGGVGARLPIGPFDPTRIDAGASAKDLPVETIVNWMAVN